MNEQLNTKTVTATRKFSQGALALLVLGAAGLASAAQITVTELNGQKAVSENSMENKLTYVTIPAASIGIVKSGSIERRLKVSAQGIRDVQFSVNHARVEAGTLFVYLDVAVGKNTALHQKLPLTILNSVTGQSVTLNVQVNAVAPRYR